MTMKIITGYTGTKHITPADDAGFHRGIFGDGDFVLPGGSQLAATIQSATEVRIADGELVMQGRHARNDSGYQAVAIANGTQGMSRNDLIVARYTKDASTSVESITLVAITGTASSGTASDPAYNIGDIENGETRDFPLYRVKLNGVNIDKVEQLWQAPVLPVDRGGTGKTSHTGNAVLTGNGTNPVKNVATANGALYATSANGAPKFGTLPIAQGGTGSTTKEGALSNLGITATAAELNFMDGVTSNVQAQLNNKAASSHTHSYLPLSGGTVNGRLSINGDITSDSVIAGNIKGGAISTNDNIKCNTLTVDSTINANGELKCTNGVEIFHTSPYIDFHYERMSGDYTSRIVESEHGKLSINGVYCTKGGALKASACEVTDERIYCEPSYNYTVTNAPNLYVGSGGGYCRSTNTSSRTIKHDIKNLTAEDIKAERLYDLEVVQFKYNDGIITDETDSRYGKDLVGFIIENMNEVYPIAVDKPSDNVKEWSWNAQYMIPPMLKLIQDLHKEVEELKAKVSTN